MSYTIIVTFIWTKYGSSLNISTKLIVNSKYNTSNSTYVVGFFERFISKGSYLPTVLSGRSLFDSQSIILELIKDLDDMLESTRCSIMRTLTLVFIELVVSKKTKFIIVNLVFLELVVSKIKFSKSCVSRACRFETQFVLMQTINI